MLKYLLSQSTYEKLKNLNTLIVGAGAIGCELIKNFAMLDIGINGKRLVFLLKEYNYEKFIYIDKLDTFILVDVSLVENAYIYVQTLPDVFNEDKLDEEFNAPAY